jgi:hypothetical protein
MKDSTDTEQERGSAVIVTRREALARGLSKYFTGKPCLHGHLSARYSRSGTCITCKYLEINRNQERTKKWMAKSLNRRREYKKAWNSDESRPRVRTRYKDNPAYFIKKAAEWAKKHPERAKQHRRTKAKNYWVRYPERVNAWSARRALKANPQMPAWANADMILKIYAEAAERSRREQNPL